MGNLKVGDKIYLKDESWRGDTIYRIEEIERVTRTLAISKAGNKFSIEAYNTDNNGIHEFVAKPYNYKRWKRLTPEIAININSYNSFRKKTIWFDNAKFTDEQKVLIHDLINKKDDAQN